jgi:hypothetical protein
MDQLAQLSERVRAAIVSITLGDELYEIFSADALHYRDLRGRHPPQPIHPLKRLNWLVS